MFTSVLPEVLLASEHSTDYVTKFIIRWTSAPFLSAHAIKLLPKFFITHLKNLIKLVVKDLCYEYSRGGVCLYSFDCVFVHKEIRCTSKTEIKDWLQYKKKKLLLPGDIVIYIWGFSNELESYYIF